LEVEVFSPNGIQAILFDLDGTLRHSEPSPDHTFFDYACQLGLEDVAERRHAAYRWTHVYWAMSPEVQADLKTFAGENKNFWRNYARLQLIAYGCSAEEATTLAPDVFQMMQEKYRPRNLVNTGVMETLSLLQERGFRLGMVSNRDVPCDDELDELGLSPFFELTLVGGEVNSYKPDPRIFYHAIERMKLKPSQALYVGDNYFADALGAQEAGLPVVLIDPIRLFPEATCPVITTMEELPDVIIQYQDPILTD
jgi:HAD superfamily hydrolase (TIGR01509 family)